MIDNLPSYIEYIFVLTTFFTLLLFYRATHKSKMVLMISLTWLLIQALLGYSEFYLITDTIPPRVVLLAGPAIGTIILLFFISKGKKWMDTLDAKWLTYLHVVRIPVEFVLLWLFMYGQVPQLMTFEGRNFDILSGISAPFIAFYGYKKAKLSRGVLIAWNLICLALLFNIVIHAILSAPTVIQQLAFNQPNVAIMYYPFVWLPCFIVPVVLFSHLVCLRRLMK